MSAPRGPRWHAGCHAQPELDPERTAVETTQRAEGRTGKPVAGRRRQLGCNYSRPLMDLLGRGTVAVDWIKLSDPETVEEELARVRPVRPVLLHTLGRAGRRPESWEAYPWDTLNRQLATADSPHIGLHLDLWAEDWDEPLELQQGSRGQAMALLERLVDGILVAKRNLRVPVLVENMPHYGPGSWRPRITIQPEAIWQVVEETGTGMVLDIAHLRCAAYHLGVDARAYARALPLDAVREVHINGPLMVPGEGLRDRHFPCGAEDYALLEWLLEQSDLGIVTLEYGGFGERIETPERNDPRALEAQLRRLGELLGR